MVIVRNCQHVTLTNHSELVRIYSTSKTCVDLPKAYILYAWSYLSIFHIPKPEPAMLFIFLLFASVRICGGDRDVHLWPLWGLRQEVPEEKRSACSPRVCGVVPGWVAQCYAGWYRFWLSCPVGFCFWLVSFLPGLSNVTLVVIISGLWLPNVIRIVIISGVAAQCYHCIYRYAGP